MTTLHAVALSLALGSEIRARKHTKRATRRCAKVMAKRLADLKSVETSNVVALAGGRLPDVAEAIAVLRRLCGSCGKCEMWGIKSPSHPQPVQHPG